jgi:hypothetical protein
MVRARGSDAFDRNGNWSTKRHHLLVNAVDLSIALSCRGHPILLPTPRPPTCLPTPRTCSPADAVDLQQYIRQPGGKYASIAKGNTYAISLRLMCIVRRSRASAALFLQQTIRSKQHTTNAAQNAHTLTRPSLKLPGTWPNACRRRQPSACFQMPQTCGYQ